MWTWFTSLNGAIILNVLAFLTLLARVTYLDAMFVPEFRIMLPEDRPAGILVMMLVYMGFAGGWVWSLLSSARGSQTGLRVSLLYSLFIALGGGLVTLVAFGPVGCAAPPVGNLIVWANLITGLTASIALAIQLRKTPEWASAPSTARGETA